MTHQNGHHDEAREPTTPFDEATDLVDADEDLVELHGLRMPPAKSLAFLGAILLAPLVGLVFGLDFALAMLVIAMVVTSWLAWEGASRLVPAQAAQLRKAAILNGVVAVVVLLLLVMRLVA